MSIERVKVGETYLLPITVTGIRISGWLNVVTLHNYGFKLNPIEIDTLSQNSIKNTEPTPKYDPCREFRAGDKVGLKTNLGRNPYDTFDGQEYIPDGTVFTVLRDERAGGHVDIFEKDESDAFTVHFSNLKLVTPVEELEPYSVVRPENYKCVRIMKGKRIHNAIPFDEDECVCLTLEQALAAAEAERDRLNANYRKAQNNV